MCLVVILSLQASALFWQTRSTGVTVDEPAHLVSSFLYWHGRDILLPRDMPPLIKIVGGAIPTAEDLGFQPADVRPGAWEWDFASKVMNRDQPQWIGPFFARARLPFLLFPLLTTCLLFLWARRQFGPEAALAAAFLFAFDPTSLAHGSLIKNDHAATLTFFVFCLAVWRYAHRPQFLSLVLLTGAVWLACSAKLSLVICLPVALAVVAITLRNWRVLPHAFFLLAGVYGAACAASWFDMAPLHPAEYGESSIAHNFSFLTPVLEPLFTGLPVPRMYWNGVNALLYWNAETNNPIYLLGEHVPAGSPWYFVVALLVKAPEGFIVLLLAGLFLVRRYPVGTITFLLVPPLVYLGAASLTAMQLGIRLVLPALPFAALLGALPFAVPLPPLVRRFAVVAVAAAGLSAVLSFPNGIGYFNHVSGSTPNGLRYLADSNLDWGQDLPALRAWMDSAQPGRIKLYYFGNDNPFRFFTDNEIEPQAPPWGPDLVSSDRLVPAPGYYAISANLIPGHAFQPRFRDYFAAFRASPPLAIAGSSIYIYRVPTENRGIRPENLNSPTHK